MTVKRRMKMQLGKRVWWATVTLMADARGEPFASLNLKETSPEPREARKWLLAERIRRRAEEEKT